MAVTPIYYKEWQNWKRLSEYHSWCSPALSNELICSHGFKAHLHTKEFHIFIFTQIFLLNSDSCLHPQGHLISISNSKCPKLTPDNCQIISTEVFPSSVDDDSIFPSVQVQTFHDLYPTRVISPFLCSHHLFSPAVPSYPVSLSTSMLHRAYTAWVTSGSPLQSPQHYSQNDPHGLCGG